LWTTADALAIDAGGWERGNIRRPSDDDVCGVGGGTRTIGDSVRGIGIEFRRTGSCEFRADGNARVIGSEVSTIDASVFAASSNVRENGTNNG
jgi:hypothetical protein